MEAISRGPVSLLYFTVQRDDFDNLHPQPALPVLSCDAGLHRRRRIHLHTVARNRSAGSKVLGGPRM